MVTKSRQRNASSHSIRRWHAVAADVALRALKVDPARGLDDSQVIERAAVHGRNTLPSAPPRGALRRFLAQFHNVLIYLLFAAAAVTFSLGERIDAFVILVTTLVNASIGFVQEGNAERAIKGIGALLPFQSIVLRGGVRRALPAQELVPGDIVYLASGDKVPADIRLLSARGLRLDESALTGEAVPVDKGSEPVRPDAGVAERACMAHSGTLVRHGSGVGVVIATGADTEIGRINALLAGIEPLTTPLLRKMASFGKWITVTVLVIAGSMFAFGSLVRDYSAFDMFTAAVGIAVAAVPEGLPAVITITLAIGVKRMARRRAIIRRLPAVEALGAVTVICTDKTGTLTRNEMAVKHVLSADALLDVTSTGYAPHGQFSEDGLRVSTAALGHLHPIALVCLLCNDAQLNLDRDQWELSGDPTEGALLSMALKAGLDAQHEHACHPRLDVIPFESEHGFMATLHATPNGDQCILLKGAPERVMPLCAYQRTRKTSEPIVYGQWERMIATAAEQGLRLIAVAMRTPAATLTELTLDTVQGGGFTLLGILAMSDPPRAEAIEAVRNCRRAGISVKMITGDHPQTARSIGEQLGFARPVQTLTGMQIDAMNEDQLDQAIATTDVFARALPEHKLRLVCALQRVGEVVVMTGDGVNDAPALKRADVGVAMGRKGTEAAKEAAEVVLADDNFATLAAAVEEGRVVYDNIRKTIVFTLPTNGGEAGMLIIAILFGLTLPITPVQILWVNMITEVTLSLALAFEKPESDVMARPPRPPSEALVTGFLVWRIVFVSLLIVCGCMLLYLWVLGQGASLAQARTVVVNGLVVAHIAYLFNTRRLHGRTLSWEGFTGNRIALVAMVVTLLFQLALTYWPPAQTWFGTAAISWKHWLGIIGFGLALMLLVELEKTVRGTRLRR